MVEFRRLRADEIECRIASCTAKGVSLLLYKDARCDQNILDETVGSMNWQRHHSRDNANCTVSLWDAEKGQWIEKEDTGTESYTEKEKGLASDSFKRACFNWGIGRELYTAPFIWFPADSLKTLAQDNGKWTCRDRFTVTAIEYDGGRITMVEIQDTSTHEYLQFGKQMSAVRSQTIGEARARALEKELSAKGVSVGVIYSQYNVSRLADLTEEQQASVIRRLNKSGGKGTA